MSNEVARRLYDCEVRGASWEEFARYLVKELSNQLLPRKDLYDKRQALRLANELIAEIEDL